MTPLFDNECNLVGWMDPGKHIFDTDMDWVAFIANGHAWSVQTENWLGEVYGLNVRDRQGRTVLWNPDQPIENSLPVLEPLQPLTPLGPLTPLTPLDPLTPLQPLEPLGGWSDLSWEEFLKQ